VGTINLQTGAFAQVGASFSVTGTQFDIDIDPVNDRMRVISNTGLNTVIDPNTGTVSAKTNLSVAADAIAYSGNFKGSAQTSLYGINVSTDQLVLVGSLNGSPNSPDTGIVTAVGSLGLNATAVAGFDIRSDGTAIAVLTVGGVDGVYSIDLGNGTATLLGNIGQAIGATADFTLSPASVFVAATGAGTSASVKVYDASTNGLIRTLSPYAASFTGGVRVATGDVNRDGVPDVIVGAGPTGGPHVQVFDGRTGVLIHSFFAFNANFAGASRWPRATSTGTGSPILSWGPEPAARPRSKCSAG